MDYVSTRGNIEPLSFKEAMLTGLAPDSGLLIPTYVPDIRSQLDRWRTLSYVDLAFEVLSQFATDIERQTLRGLIARSYESFTHPEITPVIPLGDIYLMELFHGPTLSFKDVAMQLLGNLFEHTLSEKDAAVLNILGSTSGDTGSAAIAAVRGRERLRICVLFPEERTSRIQELQMTTVLEENVHCLAIEGSFDDCQSLMKSIFSEADFKEKYQLGAVNSVNCVRLFAQVVYYFYAWGRVSDGGPVSFCVPTGNFGDIFAGYLAARMGLPVDRLILATNENDILRRFFATGTYARGKVHQTLSPSMDIQVASNFERYLYYCLHGDTRALVKFMADFADTGQAFLPEAGQVSELFIADRTTQEETLRAIKDTYDAHRYLLDPHTAVGVSVGQRQRTPSPLVCLATAHPAKFPKVIQKAIGKNIAHHPTLEGLGSMSTRKRNLPADKAAVQDYLRTHCT